MKKNKRIFSIISMLFLLTSMLMPIGKATAAFQNNGNPPPVIGTDHPTQPGQVMLFKQATPVPGMVNTWEVTLRIEGKDKPTTSDIVLVIDTSGSMAGNRLKAAKEAAIAFVDTLLPSTTTRIGVVNFDYYAHNVIGLTNNVAALHTAINGLSANGGTFTQDGVKHAEAMLASSTADNKHIVVLSDGVPTYSYEIPNNTIRRNGYVLSGNLYYTGTGYASSAYGSTRVGSGSSMYEYIERYNSRRASYHHGNSAIAEAGFAKTAGYRVWTIGLEINEGDEGYEVLQNMASPDSSYFTSDPDELEPIFTTIAGQIGAAVKNPAISDPMGPGFQIPAASVGSIITVPATPLATYDPATKKITWNPGTLTTPIAQGSDIKYAELKYRIEINDDILGIDPPPADGEYPTNSDANITYTDADGTLHQAEPFPVPKVNPVLYKVVKVLQSHDGTVITDNRNFTIQVTGPGADGPNTVRSFTLNTSTADSTKLITDLRYASTYTFEETAAEPTLSDYDITYFVTGTEVSGANRKFTIVDGNTADVEVKVVNKEKSTSVSVTKAWDDANNQDGIRPPSVTVQLYADGEKVDDATLELNADNSWTGTFSVLPKYKDDGTEIVYTVDETPVPTGYTREITGTAGEGFTITNSHIPETVDISGSKTWDDVNNQDGKRPTSITINLYKKVGEADPELVESKKVTEADGWAWSFEDQPKYEGGVEIVYSITEDAVTGYTTVVAGYNVTNSHIPETVDISGSKTWDDVNNQDGKRPTSITINLYKKVGEADPELVESKKVTEADGWAWSFEDQPKYEGGVEIVYSITEDAVTGYTTVVAGYNVTNSHIPETVDISGSKTWDDVNNQDGKRPTSITINLYKKVGEADPELVESKKVTEADGWAWSFEDQPKYEGGVEIVYSITEDAVTGYTTVVAGYNVTNSHIPETVDISGSKTWDDVNNQDGKRPTSITINLYKKVGEADPELVESKKVTEADGWAWSFEDQPKYEGGVEIVYSITEDAVTGYTTVVAGYNVTNSHIPETVDISGSKTWDDVNNQDGKRPTSITINLYKKVGEADPELVESKKVTEADGWAWSFEDQPKYEGGVEIVYSITEDAVTGYTTVVAGYNVTNSHIPETVDISGSKTWDDVNNQDGKRPTSITINLYKKVGEADPELVESKKVTEADGWAWSFEDQPKYEGGVEIVYSITEDAVTGYTTVVAGYNVTNSHIPETVDISGSKTWDDVNNQDGKRPTSITINLYKKVGEADPELVESKKVTEADGWAWSFEDQPKYEGGVEIVYSITEDAVTGYTTVVAGYNVTNSHIPETVDISGSKTWDDVNNQDGKRPTSITINLYKKVGEADPELVESKKVTEADGWAWSFEDQPKYEGGVEIVYSITEDAVTGYTTVVAGYNVTNSHIPETVDISGSKTWDDVNNQDGKRPTSITINLYKKVGEADPELVESKKVTEADGWAWSFEDQPKYEGGVEIVYSITEDAVTGYTTVVAGYNVTNSHIPETVDISGSKTWDDVNNQDGKRPTSITINLYKKVGEADPELVESKKVTEADGWAWSFEDQPKYEGGVEIVYSITEDAVTGYTTVVAGYNVTNSHIPETVDISGSKTWDDVNNQDGKRPTSITINLYKKVGEADPELVESKKVTEADGWAWSFEDQPKYEGGVEIVYSITEDAVTGYTTVVAGYNVTNSHIPETVDISGSKTWDDVNNQDGKRPTSITINLYKKVGEADPELVESKKVTEADGWAWSFEDQPKYEGGVEIVYSITEDAVTGYTTVVAGYNVTNSHIPETVDISGSKTWDDVNNQDGKRPTSITINLYKKVGEADPELVESKKVTEADGWAWSFEDQPKYEGGVEIVYSITEDAVTGYTTVVAGYNVTNSHIPETVDISGSKTWDDVNNQDGKRPTSITINLYKKVGEADPELVESKKVTEADGWAWSFEDQPKYEGGVEIVYSITEDAVTGYTTVVAGYNVTNSHIPETVDISGSKTWDDVNNQDGKRPTSITINLYKKVGEADPELVESKKVTEADGWAWSFEDQPKYEGGVEIVYSITEDAVTGYTTVVAGYNVTNSHIPETVDISGSKTWDDANNQDGKRPTSITINLYKKVGEADPELVESKTVTEADGWAWSFEDQPKYEGGVEIVYSITEDAVTGYTTVVAGYNVTNSKNGSLTIIKDAIPNSSSAVFDFTIDPEVDEPGDFTLKDDGGEENNNKKTFVLSPEQEYTVTEGELPDGWALDDIVCELVNQQIDEDPVNNGGEDEDPWDIDLENRKLSITLGTNQSAECTFINKTEGEGTIKVNKITYPETTEPAFDFTLGEDISFSLKHGETLEFSMDSGSYTLTETPPADWYLLDAVCSSSVPGKVQRPAAINLELGETVTCNFINVPPNSIAVKKVVTVPSAAKFEFYGALNGIIGHNEFLVKPNVEVTGELMSVREKPKQGWKLISIKCVEKGNVGQLATMPHLDKREALIGLDEGEVVLCTFYNDPNPEQPDGPDPEPPTSEIPKTGFPIGHLTNLPKQTAFKLYSTTNITLKVPRLDLEMPILGIPQTSENFWDVTWLDNNVGYLEGSAYPTWSGNTVLTGHVWTADNKPGPFAKVHTLGFGDKIEIVAYGQTYVYEVRSSDLVKASDVDKMMKHEKNAWVTLVTCEDFNEKTGAYLYRRLVRAVLVDKY